MGRRKPGKPRRPRIPRQLSLQEAAPPGFGYDEWFTVKTGVTPESIVNPDLDPEALDLLRRMHHLADLYEGQVPRAAVHLDHLLDTGHLPIFRGETGTLVPIEEMASVQPGASTSSVRESVHRLHAFGALVVFADEDHDVFFVRLAVRRPQEAGEGWQFDGDPDVVAATTCIPDHIWGELPIAVAGAVTYMRSCRSQLMEPDPVTYAMRDEVRDPEHARELFAAALASGAVDEKGCEACPSGHLCTRSDTE